MKRERLDKLLANQGGWSRKEVRTLVRDGRVMVDGMQTRSPEAKVETAAAITVDGRLLRIREHLYLMLNKPAGVVCATRDSRERTVMELLPPDLQRKGLFPAGRLDKDTEGFVLLTDDGEFDHSILSPRRHVPKTYQVELDGPVGQTTVEAFAQGVELDGGERTAPAALTLSGDPSRVELVITEGMYHQVKRMFATRGRKVIYLKRVKIGDLALDPHLPPGGCRELLQSEKDMICQRFVTLF